MQIANDPHALREWRNVLRRVDQLWVENLDWSFDDCLDAILAKGDKVLGGRQCNEHVSYQPQRLDN